MTRNSATDWGWPAKILHWVGAIMILLLLVHGWWMTHMTLRPERLANYAWHSAMGYDLLALLILRLLWRWLKYVAHLSRRVAALGACRRARLARCALPADVRGLGDGVDGRHHIPQSHDQGFVRHRCAADRHDSGPIGAAVARGIPHGVGLRACRRRAHPHRRGAASPPSQAQRRAAAHALEFIAWPKFVA